MKYECLDNNETKSYSLNKEKGEGEITFKGWNIGSPEVLIIAELQDYYEEEDIFDFEIVDKKEMAYSCAKWCEGTDAKDEGYSHWLNYEDIWKKGLGKCTNFRIKYRVVDKDGTD